MWLERLEKDEYIALRSLHNEPFVFKDDRPGATLRVLWRHNGRWWYADPADCVTRRDSEKPGQYKEGWWARAIAAMQAVEKRGLAYGRRQHAVDNEPGHGNDRLELVLTKRGQAMLTAFDRNNSVTETAHLMGSPANAAHLSRSIAQLRNGRAKHHESIEPEKPEGTQKSAGEAG